VRSFLQVAGWVALGVGLFAVVGNGLWLVWWIMLEDPSLNAMIPYAFAL
jgi:hypothetical protein